MLRIAWKDVERQVATCAELEALLDHLHEEFEKEAPELVEVELSDSKDCLTIGLGKSVSVLSFVAGNKAPPYWCSQGDVGAGDGVWFGFHGERSEFPMFTAISVRDARIAMRYFCQTGKLTQAVRWVEG